MNETKIMFVDERSWSVVLKYADNSGANRAGDEHLKTIEYFISSTEQHTSFWLDVQGPRAGIPEQIGFVRSFEKLTVL